MLYSTFWQTSTWDTQTYHPLVPTGSENLQKPRRPAGDDPHSEKNSPSGEEYRKLDRHGNVYHAKV